MAFYNYTKFFLRKIKSMNAQLQKPNTTEDNVGFEIIYVYQLYTNTQVHQKA